MIFTCESNREKRWEYDGSKLASNVFVVGENANRLVIQGATYLNTGVYRCVTITDDGEEDAVEVELTVICKSHALLTLPHTLVTLILV